MRDSGRAWSKTNSNHIICIVSEMAGILKYMPTLSETIYETKTIFKWLGLILGGVLLIFILIALKNSFFPAPPPPPQVSFGKLPPADFVLNAASKNYSYSLDTISGSLPALPAQIKVFEMQEAQPDLLALSKAQSIVTNVGFSTSPLKISDNIYQWRDDAGRVLTMNIETQNFNVFSNFITKSNQPNFDKDVQSAITTASNFLTSTNLMPADIDPSKTQTTLLAVDNLTIVPATSLSSTKFVSVNFFQKAFSGFPILYPGFSTSPINFLIGQVNGDSQVVAANFFYQKISSISSTYPIKTSSMAFDDLKKGNAYVASSQNSKSVLIKNIYPAYYVSEAKQDFFLPIIVLQGDNGFVAYENAIRDEWVNK